MDFEENLMRMEASTLHLNLKLMAEKGHWHQKFGIFVLLADRELVYSQRVWTFFFLFGDIVCDYGILSVPVLRN